MKKSVIEIKNIGKSYMIIEKDKKEKLIRLVGKYLRK